MEIKNEKLINAETVKMLINQKEYRIYKIMNININMSDTKKCRVEIDYSRNFERLIKEYQSELLELGENLYKRFKKSIERNKDKLNNLKYTALEVSIESNCLGNYIVIDVPLLRLISENDIENKNRIFLKYTIERFNQISQEMTYSLHAFIDKYFCEIEKMPEINEYEFIMYHDNGTLLYDDFIQTSEIDYALERYNIFRLASKEDLLEKLEDKILNSSIRMANRRYYKVNFNYQNKEITNVNCCPVLRQ